MKPLCYHIFIARFRCLVNDVDALKYTVDYQAIV